jgi:hydrogenase/urease accessory protein HupE
VTGRIHAPSVWVAVGGAVFFALSGMRPLEAHTTLPAYLELNEVQSNRFEVIWRVPAAQGPPPAIYPVLPSNCQPIKDNSETATLMFVLTRAVIDCGGKGIADQEIAIEGLRVTIMDVLVRVTFMDGTKVTHILRASEPALVVRKTGGNNADVWGYVRLGISHILTGIDHLLFVLGLLLIVVGFRRLLKAITAFTVAHSITLGLATFGVVRISPRPVEAVIALSIVFLAVELARHQRGMDGLTFRKPWLVAFAFGLLHGFGFAGTLTQVGIPAGDIPRALLSFNVGVEIGQVGFIGVVLALVASLRTLEVSLPQWSRAVPLYTIGSFASFWFFQRCALILAQ